MAEASVTSQIRPGAGWKPGMRTYGDISYETADGIAKITICRPEVRNAFRPQTLFELRDAFEDARDDPAIGVIILTGQGDLQASWTFQWPASGTRGPASFDGVIDGGTAHFAAAHGTFHAATLPDGDMQLTAEIGAGQR